MTTPDILLVVSAVTVAITTIVNAVGSQFNRAKLNTANVKLDTIHENTNGKVVKLQADLDIARARLADIERTERT